MIDDSWYQRPPAAPVEQLAGGVVVRRADGRLLVALIREGARPGYSLPKGHVESGETPEQAAEREVAEETGLRGLMLLGGLGVRERLDFTRRVWNVTHYFLFLAPPTWRGRAEWFLLEDLPVMFWPEQRGLIETAQARLQTVMKRSVVDQFTTRAAAYARSASHAGDDDLSLLIRHLRLRPTDRVLDVATGTGFTALAARRVARFVVGLDLTPEMLLEARKLAATSDIHWVEGDAEALPFRPASFSVAVVRRAPHHFPDVDRAVREMLRVTDPGGRVGIVDQVPPDDPAGRALMEHLERLRDPSHVRALSAGEWGRLIEASGAVIEFSRVIESPVTFAEWLDLAGVEPGRVKAIEAALDAAPAEARVQIGDLAARPRRFQKRRIVLVARNP